MIGLAVLVAVAAVVAALVRGRGSAAAPAGHPASLAAALGRAVAEGTVSAEQARAVLASEEAREAAASEAAARTASARGAGPLVAPLVEVLGYFGGVLVTVGAAMLAGQGFGDWPIGLRVGVLAGLSAILAGAGAFVPEARDPVFWRLRGVLWLASSGAFAGAAALTVVGWIGIESAWAAVWVGLALAAYGMALWRNRDRPGQQMAFLGGVITTLAGVVVLLHGRPATVGVVLWALGGLWLALSHRALVVPGMVGEVLGCALALVGAGMTTEAWEGLGSMVGLATAGLLVLVGTKLHDPAVMFIGVGGSAVYLPMAVAYWFGEGTGAPAALVVLGAVLLTTMVLAQRRHDRRHPDGLMH